MPDSQEPDDTARQLFLRRIHERFPARSLYIIHQASGVKTLSAAELAEQYPDVQREQW
jgi:hypothetical protein